MVDVSITPTILSGAGVFSVASSIYSEFLGSGSDLRGFEKPEDRKYNHFGYGTFMNKYHGGATVHCDGKTTKFKSPFIITFTAFGKVWTLDGSKISEKRLVFVPAPEGGYKGGAHYLKRWRKDKNTPKPNGKHEEWSQTKTAEFLGVTQPYIVAIEKGKKDFPPRFYEKIARETPKHKGRDVRELDER